MRDILAVIGGFTVFVVGLAVLVTAIETVAELYRRRAARKAAIRELVATRSKVSA